MSSPRWRTWRASTLGSTWSKWPRQKESPIFCRFFWTLGKQSFFFSLWKFVIFGSNPPAWTQELTPKKLLHHLFWPQSTDTSKLSPCWIHISKRIRTTFSSSSLRFERAKEIIPNWKVSFWCLQLLVWGHNVPIEEFKEVLGKIPLDKVSICIDLITRLSGRGVFLTQYLWTPGKHAIEDPDPKIQKTKIQKTPGLDIATFTNFTIYFSTLLPL